jgi:Gamma-glutamyltranspeptidase
VFLFSHSVEISDPVPLTWEYCCSLVFPSQFALVYTDAKPHRVSTDFIDARKHPTPLIEGQKVTEVGDCREIAPQAATMDMFDGKPKDATWTGGLAIAVPGQLHCLKLMHSRHGKLAWRDAVAPVVALARDGVEITPYLGHAINLVSRQKKIFEHEALKILLTKDHAGHESLQTGDILTYPALTDTLEAIVEEGTAAIYKGERAEKIAQEIQAAGGILSRPKILPTIDRHCTILSSRSLVKSWDLPWLAFHHRARDAVS